MTVTLGLPHSVFCRISSFGRELSDAPAVASRTMSFEVSINWGDSNPIDYRYPYYIRIFPYMIGSFLVGDVGTAVAKPRNVYTD